jgi:integrase
MIDAIAEKWLAWRNYPPRSEYQHRRHLELLLKSHKEVGEVDRKAASKFVSEVVTPGRDGDTINKMLSTYRQLWKWLKREEIVSGENPWSEQGPPKGAKVKGKRSSNGSDNRRPFTEEEARTFLTGLAEGVDREVSMLLSVTGMRIEEACSLLCTDVTEGRGATWLQITAAKTEAGKRRVPVVDAEVRAMLHKRITAQEHASHGKKAAPVFPELPIDRFGDPSKPLVNALGEGSAASA